MKNERDKIDDLFRQKLKGYQVKPSAKIWTNIANRFFHTGAGFLHLVNLQNIIGAVILAGAGITAYVLLNSSGSYEINEGKTVTGTPSGKPGSNDHLTSPNTHTISIPSEKNPVNQAESAETQNISRSQSNQSNLYQETLRKDAVQTTSDGITESLPDDYQTNEPQVPLNFHEKRFSVSISRIPILSSQVELRSSLSRSNPPGMDRQDRMRHEDIRMNKDDYRKPVQFSAGLYFLPEWSDYGSLSGALQSGYTQEIMACVQIGNFMLRPGLEITRSQDNGNYEVNYSKFEMTGYYLGTNFENWGNPSDTMSYVLDEHGLYDTVFYNESYRTDNTYTYLQIPLQVGYKFLKHKRFSMAVSGGPCLSLLLNEKKSDPAFSDFAAENIMMVDQTPEKKYSNWQLLLGLSSQYMITGKFSLSVEPTYRQYFQSTYDGNGSGRPPYSFGVRAGLSYHF